MRKFEAVKETMQKVQDHKDGMIVQLPLRSTKTSAGYDFYATEDMIIRPQDKVTIATDVKVQIPEDEFLLMVVRSSKGIKDDLILANTLGIIDSDYYNNPKNDGNLHICLRNLRPSMKLKGTTILNLNKEGYNVSNDENTSDLVKGFTVECAYDDCIRIPIIEDLTEENTVVIPRGERVVQGIFVKYSTAENCNSDNDRLGGIGSTDNK